jgi:hypothetical protein
MKLTKAQTRALNWLPNDGSWTNVTEDRPSHALNSLSLRKLCECEWGSFGPKGGQQLRWRLTLAGVHARMDMSSQ